MIVSQILVVGNTYLAKVKEILEEHPDNRNYGVDRVCLALEQDGVDVSRRTVSRVMKENGWLHKKRIPHGITKASTEIQEQENLVSQRDTACRVTWIFSASAYCDNPFFVRSSKITSFVSIAITTSQISYHHDSEKPGNSLLLLPVLPILADWLR